MITKKIEKNTHISILKILYRETNNVVYLRYISEFYSFMNYNNFTYITACYYFIDIFNNKEY